MSKILLVDDDRDTANSIKDFLDAQKYVVEVAHTAELARDLLKSFHYDVMILDWKLPGMSGLELLREIRGTSIQLPVLMLTGNESLQSRLDGLDGGADDYLTKPFHMGELGARVRALLRRPAQAAPSLVSAGGLTIDVAARRVIKDGMPVDLLPKEFALLDLFVRNPNQFFDSDAILERVWHSEGEAGPETVRTTMARLRKKIDTEGQESIIRNVRGYGYIFEPDSSS